MKKFSTIIQENSQIKSVTDAIKQSILEEQRWKEIIQKDFEDLGILSKGNNGLKLDMRLDGFHNYEYSNHKPCVYFRVGSGEYDFLPMIISSKPYIPYSFEQTISDEDLLWVYSWVKTNKDALLKFANEKIGYNSLFSLIRKNISTLESIIEGKAKIPQSESGLTRIVWIGPYDGTGHYLRLKIQTPKSSRNSNEWATLSIPDLELIGEHDLKQKEITILNQETLNQFAKDEINLETMLHKLIKVDKKGNAVVNNNNNDNTTEHSIKD